MGHWLGNLIVGGRGVLLTDRKITPHDLLETTHKEGVTELMLYVPWVMDLLLALERGELRKEEYDLSCLRLMHCGAQTVPLALVERWQRQFPNVPYIETYGLSESTGPGCIWIVGIEKTEGLIGTPGFNWEARVVNEQDEDVLPGEVGEIIVRGNGVMKEYYKNPEKTAETIKNGWLYTGDMARMDSESFIYLVDRKKDVIITGGENIYPVEIEEVLHSHPKVYDAAVIGLPDERLGEIAVAIIDPQPGKKLTEEEINMFCEQNLPRYRRPRRIIFDKVPRNHTGKIEKPKLREKYQINPVIDVSEK